MGDGTLRYTQSEQVNTVNTSRQMDGTVREEGEIQTIQRPVNSPYLGILETLPREGHLRLHLLELEVLDGRLLRERARGAEERNPRRPALVTLSTTVGLAFAHDAGVDGVVGGWVGGWGVYVGRVGL